MPPRFSITLLQPIAAQTPLAAVLNRWLAALAPAEVLTRTGRPSAARNYLQLVTRSLHRYHFALTESARVLHLGLPTSSLEDYCINSPGEPSLCVPVPQLIRALGLAALGKKLPSSISVGVALKRGEHYMRRAIAESGDFAETAALAEALLDSGKIIGFGLLGRSALSSNELLSLIEQVLNAQPITPTPTENASNSNIASPRL